MYITVGLCMHKYTAGFENIICLKFFLPMQETWDTQQITLQSDKNAQARVGSKIYSNISKLHFATQMIEIK